jgi:monoamine oxidase
MRATDRRAKGERRVLVLGAGAAGLAAAGALARAGLEVLVLEARDRLLGRVHTVPDPAGGTVELGAEFVHGRPAVVRRLAREAGVALRRVPERHVRGARRGLLEVTDRFEEAQGLLARGERDEPFERVLRRAGPGASREALRQARSFVEGFYLADPRTASALALAEMTRGMDEIGGDAAFRAAGGWAALLAPLARAAEGRVRLGVEAVEVRWREGAVEVRARGPAGGPVGPFRGDAAVVALPLGVLRGGGLRFSPALLSHARAAARVEVGPVVKAVLRFRALPARLRGEAFLHAPGEPFPVFWTLLPWRAPVVVGWAGGPSAAALAGRPERELAAAAVSALARGLRVEREAVEDALEAVRVADWTVDPFARGGYAVFPAGAAGAERDLAAPVQGTLFFAGEHAGPLAAAGTVPGAIASGERAAGEVIEALRAR